MDFLFYPQNSSLLWYISLKQYIFYLGASMRACSYCGEQELDLLRCSQCKSEFYCSKICQKQHWKKGHKESCKAMSGQGKQSKIDKITSIAELSTNF